MDRNYLIDLAISIIQDATDEWHIKEELSGLENELENIDKNELPDLYADRLKKIDDCKIDYLEGAELRRAKTDYLALKSPNYNYHRRCMLKHRGVAYVTMTETYLADPNDVSYNLMLKAEKRFYKALKEFMGVDTIPNCGRCLSDELNRIGYA